MSSPLTQRRFQTPLGREVGATAVEYGLMVALIAIMIFGGAWLVGPNLAALFDKVANSL